MKAINSKRIILASLLGLLIVFETFQQKFYLETFSLTSEKPSFWLLFFNHSWRWLLLIICALPVLLYYQKVNRAFRNVLTGWLKISIGVMMVFAVVLAIVLISIFSRHFQNAGEGILIEYIQFFIYQKGALFALAMLLFTMFFENEYQQQEIENQSSTITILNETNFFLNKTVKKENQPVIEVKSNNRQVSVPLNRIYRFEADDYCTRIYTVNEFYIVRKSLRSFEKELEEYQFFRIHRSVIVNLEFVKEYNYKENKVKLIDGTKLTVSKSRTNKLLQIMDINAVA